MKKMFVSMLAAIMLFSCLTGCGAGSGNQTGDESQVYNIKFECVLNEASRWYQMGQKMAQLLDERTNGRIKMTCTANSQLAGGNQQKGMENVINNVVQVDCRSSMLWQIFDDKLGVWAIPFFYDSIEHVIDDLQYDKAGELYGEAFARLGVKFAGLVEYGSRPIATNKPLTCYEDIQGMKIRVASVPLHLDGLTALGANPMAMNWSEMYTGLQQGQVDGMEAPFQVLIDNTIPDVCKYVYDCNWVSDPGVVVVNQKFYDSLPDDLKQIFDEVFKECQQWNIEMTRQDNAQAKIDLAEKYGCTITEMKDADREKFVAGMQPVIKAFEEKVGAEYLDNYRK